MVVLCGCAISIKAGRKVGAGKMADNRYGCVKIKALRALADASPGALSTRVLCIYSGIEYRVMVVSLLKWLKQGLIIKSIEPNFAHQCSEAVYTLTSKGMHWLFNNQSQYASYLAELASW